MTIQAVSVSHSSPRAGVYRSRVNATAALMALTALIACLSTAPWSFTIVTWLRDVALWIAFFGVGLLAGWLMNRYCVKGEDLLSRNSLFNLGAACQLILWMAILAIILALVTVGSTGWMPWVVFCSACGLSALYVRFLGMA